MLELCKDRTNILHLDEETVLEEAKNLTVDKMLLAIRQNGTIQVILELISWYDKIANSVHETELSTIIVSFLCYV